MTKGQIIARGLITGTATAGLLLLTQCPPTPPAPPPPPPPASDGGVSGCMASCPTPPTGCVRSSIDPGACADSGCTGPLPQCHYQASPGVQVDCPSVLAGRCIPPN